MFIDHSHSLLAFSTALGGTSAPPPYASEALYGAGPSTWRFDVTTKRLGDGKHFACCVVLDIGAQTCLAVVVKSRFTTADLVDTFDGLLEEHGAPDVLVLSNQTQPDMRGLAMWAVHNGVEVVHDLPQRVAAFGMRTPTDERWSNLAQARRTVERWRRAFNRGEAARH